VDRDVAAAGDIGERSRMYLTRVGRAASGAFSTCFNGGEERIRTREEFEGRVHKRAGR
jgi:hypothetical protein